MRVRGRAGGQRIVRCGMTGGAGRGGDPAGQNVLWCGVRGTCSVHLFLNSERSHPPRPSVHHLPEKSGIYHFLINLSSGMGEWYMKVVFEVLILFSLLSLISFT